MSRKEDTKELVKSVGDYRFTMTECAESLEYYMQLVEDQAFETIILKQRVAELEKSNKYVNQINLNLVAELSRLRKSSKELEPEMSLDEMIENGKEVLHRSINIKGVMDKETIDISKQLDKLIVRKMSLNNRND